MTSKPVLVYEGERRKTRKSEAIIDQIHLKYHPIFSFKVQCQSYGRNVSENAILFNVYIH